MFNELFIQAQDELSAIVDVSEQALFQMIFNLVNVAVLVAVLAWLLHKPMTKFLEDRKERIRLDLENAANRLAEAEEKHSQYEGKLRAINTERDEILENARKLGQDKQNEIIEKANTDARSILERAQKDVEREKEKAQDEMRSQIIQVSALMAEKLLARGMDEADKEKILTDAMNELGDAVWKC